MAVEGLEGYSPIACEYANNPRNVGPLNVFNAYAKVKGDCGDTMEFWLFVQEGVLKKAAFATDGCAPSRACGGMLTVLAEGKPMKKVKELQAEDILDALGEVPQAAEHCALLAVESLTAACRNYQQQRGAACPSNQSPQKQNDMQESQDRLQARLGRIKHKTAVLSGKGGVGKSTVAVNLAMALREAGNKVGLLDVDIHGPSVPTMLGVEGKLLDGNADGLLPIDCDGLKVMSVGFLLTNQDDAVIWRGPRKMGVIEQFLKDVVWGDLDYLIIDSPPGTGDEPLSVCQLIGSLDGAVIVTTPQKVAAVDVRKSITFCRQLDVPVLGVVENMNGFVCPKCGEITHILSSGGGAKIASDMKVPFLGSLPIDPRVAVAGDSGTPFVRHHAESATAEIMRDIMQPIAGLNQKHNLDKAENG
ncbi:Chromosome partitioning ATPase, Mrp family, contains Fe-S cluster [Malonomonas rubra DSM 5091]|uniref:Iron-sulfur cluster carrier protein n=1 Tax=Malonomonas rubra DSM 5091 TaxID=1122189 RepID=A0A1M6EV96_MALRU|nr:P-loop NTPase [Malonomonas rubra]SHI89290.1 Chromosome partitioning ATPase, Mrp family, contains Fe-S cluster [Malonomonas rubra DSM 5091]